MLSTIFSVAGLIVVACFYYVQLDVAWVFLVGVILFIIGTIFSIQSFMKREKGFWKYSPICVLGIYVIGVALSVVLLVFMGEA
ncbi:hypothetical protein [Lysinibacillus sp. NPDC086135]|uniref:hypothetical protein n=1 Tax=Lysinibacillus sp. NPDC086135 TaxID=3364130 RepID=UPI00381877D2